MKKDIKKKLISTLLSSILLLSGCSMDYARTKVKMKDNKEYYLNNLLYLEKDGNITCVLER